MKNTLLRSSRPLCHALLPSWVALPAAAALLGLAVPGAPSTLRAQSISLDASYNPPLFTTSVQASRVLELSNGQFLVFSGYADPFVGFDRASGVTTGNLVRYNADGSRDTTFQLDPALRTQSVAAVAPMASGQYVVTTSFVAENADNTGANSRVYRLNADGSLDASFNPGAGTNGDSLLRGVAVQSDGKVITGGTGVTSYNGVANTGLLRLNADGSVDTSFNVTLADDPNSPLGFVDFGLAITTDTGIQVQSDDKIVIAGGFNTVDGVTEPAVARLNADGSLDTGFVPTGFSISYYQNPEYPSTPQSRVIRSVGIQSDGKIVLGGFFNATGGISGQPLVRLNADGSLDGTFNAAVPSSFPQVFTLRIGADGKIVFSTEGNTYYRYNADGSEDTAFDANRPDLESTYGSTTNGIGIQADGKVLLAGGVTTANGIPVSGVVRLNADGTLDTSLLINGLAADAPPSHLAARADGTVLASGVFDTVGGQARAGLALLNADGSLNATILSTAFVAGESFGNPDFVLQSDGGIFLYGPTPFDEDTGSTGFTYLRLNADLSVDATLTADPSVSQFYGVLYQPGSGYLLSTGAFSVDAYAAANPSTDNAAFFLPRLTLQGEPDATFQPGIDVSTILTRSGGQIATVAVGVDGPLVLQTDGKILYQYFALDSTYHLIRLNADGSPDTTFTTGTVAPANPPTSGYTDPLTDANGNTYQATAIDAAQSGVTGVTEQADGRLLVYGGFTQYDGQTASGLARLNTDGTLDATFSVGTGPQGAGANGGLPAAVTSAQVQADGKILLAGNFATFNGAGPVGVARLNSDGSTDTTFTGAGLVSLQPSIGSAGEGAGPSQLALEPDGSFLLTGNFVTSAGAGSGSFFHLLADGLPSFFDGAVSLSRGFYYLALPDGNAFGYYSLDYYPYLYHNDLGFEYVFDANDGRSGVYLYDFASQTFFYASPTFPFPYLYDFTLNTVLYYYPDPHHAGFYTKNPRYFYDFATQAIITK